MYGWEKKSSFPSYLYLIEQTGELLFHFNKWRDFLWTNSIELWQNNLLKEVWKKCKYQDFKA